MTQETDAANYFEMSSAIPFSRMLEILTSAIEHAGMTVFARIDHAAGALLSGLRMPPSVVLIYGNPAGGTPVMLASPRAALDLPLSVGPRSS
jgi:uncharacterized protein (DUF302 family)